jgi:serine/threonine protein kinase
MELVNDITHGLNALHDCGIVHADLNPDNILVCETEERAIAKIADFGFSIILQEVEFTTPWAGGTLGWRAPEWNTVISSESLPKVDIYALGLVIWSILLDGRPPWDHDTSEPDRARRKMKFEDSKKDDSIMEKASEEIAVAYFDDDSAFAIQTLRNTLPRNPVDRSIGGLLKQSKPSGDSDEDTEQRAFEPVRSATSIREVSFSYRAKGCANSALLENWTNAVASVTSCCLVFIP